MEIEKMRILAELHDKGWSLATGVGFTDGHAIDDVALRDLIGLVGRPSSRDGDSVVWPVRPRSARPDATFSMRSGAAELHTDAAYRADPEAWVALFCVRPARDGGLSTLLTVDDLMFGLPDDLERQLRRPAWRWRPPEVFGGDVTPPHPVLGSGKTVRWRYDTLVPTAQRSAPARAFRDHLADHPGIRRISLSTDSVLFVDNHRALHGRTAFSDPDRLLLRVRLRRDARSR